MGDELSSHSNDGRIATEKSGHIFLIVIDRPKKLNGFNVKMLSELGQAFSAMEDDSDIRCGVLCAEGRNFTAVKIGDATAIDGCLKIRGPSEGRGSPRSKPG